MKAAAASFRLLRPNGRAGGAPPARRDPALGAPSETPERPETPETPETSETPESSETLEDRLLQHGADRLSDAELVTLLVGRRGREREAAAAAAALLDHLGSLRRAATATVDEVARLGRVPLGAAARLAAAFALGRRAAAKRWVKGAPFRTSLDIFERFHPLLRDSMKERFVVVLLDGKNRVMRSEEVSEGTLTSSLVHPREVFAPALRESAHGLVCVHNHPSGDPEPSNEDVEITRRLIAVGDLLGIKLMDHVVIGDGAYTSFLDRGWIHA